MLIEEIKEIVAIENENLGNKINMENTETLLINSDDLIIEALSLEHELVTDVNTIDMYTNIMYPVDSFEKVGYDLLGIPTTEDDKSLWDKFKALIKKIIDFIVDKFKKLTGYITTFVKSVLGMKRKINNKISRLEKLLNEYKKSGRVNLLGDFPKHIKESLFDMFKITLAIEEKLDSEALINFIDKQKRIINHDYNMFDTLMLKNILPDLDKIIKQIKNYDKNKDDLLKQIKAMSSVISGYFVNYSMHDANTRDLIRILNVAIGSCDKYMDNIDSCVYDLVGLQTNNIRVLDIYRYNASGSLKQDIKVVTLNEILNKSNPLRTLLRDSKRNAKNLDIEPISVEDGLLLLKLWKSTLKEIEPVIELIEIKYNKIEKEINKKLDTIFKLLDDQGDKFDDNFKKAITVLINLINIYLLKVLSYYNTGLYATVRSLYSDYYITYIDLSMKLMTK